MGLWDTVYVFCPGCCATGTLSLDQGHLASQLGELGLPLPDFLAGDKD